MTEHNQNAHEQPNMDTQNPIAPNPFDLLSSADNQEVITKLLQKIMPLIQGGRMDNIVDLISLVSDLVEFMDAAALEKTTKAGEEVLAAGWAVSNAVRLAHSRTCAKEEAPSLIALTRQLNDADTRRGISFILETVKLLGQQLQPLPQHEDF